MAVALRSIDISDPTEKNIQNLAINEQTLNQQRGVEKSTFTVNSTDKKQANTQQLAQEAFPGELALLRQQSSQANLLIDAMPTGLVMLDGNGIVIKINPVARLLLDEPILGQPWVNVIQRSFKPRKDDWHEVSLNDGRRVKLEIRTLGDQPGQLIVITDLTETRLLQDKISQMQRLSSLGRMVSTLAHQIRTPLSAAILYGANLSNNKLTLRDRVNFQDKLMSRLQDLEQQVNDMLLYAKSGKQQVLEVLSVNKLIADSIQTLDAQIGAVGAKISVRYCPDGCQILGNKRALMGAIQNLVNNSLQLIPEKAEINIAVACQKEFVFIDVKDNGAGISKELHDKIFEPFFTNRAQGTGLGLAVVKSVAHAHQGDASLQSKPGESAHFRIKLPVFSVGNKTKKSAHKQQG
jgi:two-component system sensor histidine kinase FlrB